MAEAMECSKFEGCHVCLDDNASENNLLVYCDGQSCELAAHQFCYGISSVPSGQWFCKTCEENIEPKSLECRLCPLKGGAMKRIKGTDDWSHIICALYVPEVTFEDVNLMESIIIDSIPENKYELECYICEEENRPKCAQYGACMKCSKSGCSRGMHATCAQIKGQIMEVTNGRQVETKYCGYCHEHLPKKKQQTSLKSKEIEEVLYSGYVFDTETSQDSFELYHNDNTRTVHSCKQELNTNKIVLKIKQESPKHLSQVTPATSSALKVKKSSGGRPRKYTTKNNSAELSKVTKKRGLKGTKLATKMKQRTMIQGAMRDVDQSSEVSQEVKEESGYILHPKHSLLSLSSFGSDALEPSNPNTVGQLKPTVGTETSQAPTNVIRNVQDAFTQQAREFSEVLIQNAATEEMRRELEEYNQLGQDCDHLRKMIAIYKRRIELLNKVSRSLDRLDGVSG